MRKRNVNLQVRITKEERELIDEVANKMSDCNTLTDVIVKLFRDRKEHEKCQKGKQLAI